MARSWRLSGGCRSSARPPPAFIRSPAWRRGAAGLCRADDVAHAKPEPDLYVAVLACLGVSASEAIAIEDSPHGITAARRAGMRCVAIPNNITAQLDLTYADLLLGSLAEVSLDQLMERLGTA